MQAMKKGEKERKKGEEVETNYETECTSMVWCAKGLIFHRYYSGPLSVGR